MEMLQTHKLLTVDIFLPGSSGGGAAWRERENETNIQTEAELRHEEQILVSLQFLAKAPFHITQLNPCPWLR